MEIQTIIELPDGAYNGRLDENGRVRLPASLKTFFDELKDRKLFVTSQDERIAQIYPIAKWRDVRNSLERSKEYRRVALDVLWAMLDNGQNTEVDGQGRVVIHPELRRKLGIENQAVKLVSCGGRIDVYAEALYKERDQQAKTDLAQKVVQLQDAGVI